jgi:hypothetical protein
VPYSKTVDVDELLLWTGGATGDIPYWNGSAFVPSVLTYVDAAQDELVVNEAGADVDFRVEAVGQTNAVVVQGSDGKVGIGTGSPSDLLDVRGDVWFGQHSTASLIKIGAIGNNNFGSLSKFSLKFNGRQTLDYNVTDGSLDISAPVLNYIRLNHRTIVGTGTIVAGIGLAVMNGKVGIGTVAPGTQLTVYESTAQTNTVQNLFTLNHFSTATPVAGFGGGISLKLKSSVTADRDAAAIEWLWNVPTDAVRQGELILSAYDTAKRRGVHIRASGTAPELGFLEADPVPRQAHIADASGGGGNIDATVNAILDALEAFGLVATS